MEDQNPKADRVQSYAEKQAAARAIIAARIEAMELSGELYPKNVEIIFPPQMKAKSDLDAVVIPVFDVLNWLAADLESEKPDMAQFWREIAEEYYKEDEDEDDLGDEELSARMNIDLGGLEELVAEMDANSRDTMTASVLKDD